MESEQRCGREAASESLRRLAAATGYDPYQPGADENQSARFRRNAPSAHLASASQCENVAGRIHIHDVETTRGCEDVVRRVSVYVRNGQSQASAERRECITDFRLVFLSTAYHEGKKTELSASRVGCAALRHGKKTAALIQEGYDCTGLAVQNAELRLR